MRIVGPASHPLRGGYGEFWPKNQFFFIFAVSLTLCPTDLLSTKKSELFSGYEKKKKID